MHLNLNLNFKLLWFIVGLASLTILPVTTQTYGAGNIDPTANPPFLTCNTGTAGSSTGGGFDMAEYVISGNLDDKDKLKGKDNTFQVFADLVKDDGYDIKGKDAPYKANVLTDDGDKKVKASIEEIATLCIDIQKIKNIKKATSVNLKSSPLFKSLDY